MLSSIVQKKSCFPSDKQFDDILTSYKSLFAKYPSPTISSKKVSLTEADSRKVQQLTSVCCHQAKVNFIDSLIHIAPLS